MKNLLILVIGLFVAFSSDRVQAQQAGVANVSALLQIPAGGNSPTLGFVTATGGDFLIRGIGPSLSMFGVSTPDASPTVVCLDSTGLDVLTRPTSGRVPLDWNIVFTSVGAFPVTAGTLDYYHMVTLQAGSYTLTAKDKSGKGGAVLIEVYANANWGPTAE